MKLFAAVPSYTANCSLQFTGCLMALVKRYPGELDISFHIGHGYPGKARNEMADDFLKSGYDKILFIDNDVLFTPEDVVQVSSHEEPIVGGFYFKKEPKGKAVCEALDGQSGELKTGENGLIEVKYMGNGFLCVHRDVFTKMMDLENAMKLRMLIYVEENTQRSFWDFFPHGVHPDLARWLGEDWYFCHRAREIGYKIYGDPKVTMGHLGSAVYPLPPPLPPTGDPIGAALRSVPFGNRE